MLTDIVFWGLLLPFMTGENFQLTLVSYGLLIGAKVDFTCCTLLNCKARILFSDPLLGEICYDLNLQITIKSFPTFLTFHFC